MEFMPHGHCYFWKPEILWPIVLGGMGHVIAYFVIGSILLYGSHKVARTPTTTAALAPFLYLFSFFILTCGMTHLIGIWTIWNPDYAEQGYMMAISGSVSMFTMIVVLLNLKKLGNVVGLK